MVRLGFREDGSGEILLRRSGSRVLIRLLCTVSGCVAEVLEMHA